MVAVIGLLFGILLGLIIDVKFPSYLTSYMSVAILACLDSVFGAVRANLSKNFKQDIFISGFFGNSILAAALAFLGDKLGIPIYMAAVIVFGGRIFDNFAIIRRLVIEKLRAKRRDNNEERN